MASSSGPYETLFKKAQNATPKSLPEGAWYIIVAATLMTADGGKHLGELYQFILKELGSNSTSESRQNVSRRLRAVIIKEWTLVGMPRASDGLFSLVKVEDPSDAAQDWDRSDFAAEPEKATKRTQVWWQQVFGEEAAGIYKSYETNPDFCEYMAHLDPAAARVADFTKHGPSTSPCTVSSWPICLFWDRSRTNW